MDVIFKLFLFVFHLSVDFGRLINYFLQIPPQEAIKSSAIDVK